MARRCYCPTPLRPISFLLARRSWPYRFDGLGIELPFLSITSSNALIALRTSPLMVVSCVLAIFLSRVKSFLSMRTSKTEFFLFVLAVAGMFVLLVPVVLCASCPFIVQCICWSVKCQVPFFVLLGYMFDYLPHNWWAYGVSNHLDTISM